MEARNEGEFTADCLKENRTNDLTRVELTWFEKLIEHWIRFGRIAEETILDRLVRWAANDFGTVVSRIDIARARQRRANPIRRCRS